MGFVWSQEKKTLGIVKISCSRRENCLEGGLYVVEPGFCMAVALVVLGMMVPGVVVLTVGVLGGVGEFKMIVKSMLSLRCL